jgi:O-antigen/teichoic acid export membrane protein
MSFKAALNARSPFGRWTSSIAAIGVGALAQAASLVIFARALGPAEYAIIVLASATAQIAAEIVGLGTGDLLIREVSRNPEAHRAEFGRSLWLVGLTLLPLAAIASALAWFSFGRASALVLFLLIASDMVAVRMSIMGEQIAIAHHATHTANVIRIYTALTRLLVVCFAVFVVRTSTASQWSVIAPASAALVAIGAVTVSARRFGAPYLRAGPGTWRHVGILFSLMQIIRAVQFSIDKYAVAAVASPMALGAFGVASRASQLGIMPASAINRITYPLFFQKGREGLNSALQFARKIVPAVIGVAILSSAGLVGIAFLLPLLLGSEFAPTKGYLILLAVLPLLSALQNLPGDVLTGSDLQPHRVSAAFVGLLLSIATTVVGARHAGVEGAIVGYLVGQLLVAAALWITLAAVKKRHRMQPI